MKHATPETLALHHEFLAQIREHRTLTERKFGTFYRKSNAILHFHEDAVGLFADLKIDGDWQRFPVNTNSERKTLLDTLQAIIGNQL